MLDRAYPHTGWFTQSEEPHCTKEYNYVMNPINHNYIEWGERATRSGVVKYLTSLVYVARPYLTAVHVTERRNLVYNFRSLLKRNQKGHLVAGIYFPVSEKDQQFTIFYENNSEKQRIKMKFAMFLEEDKCPDHLLEHLTSCNNQMKAKNGSLLTMIQKLACIMSDNTYINQVLGINDEICQMSSDN